MAIAETFSVNLGELADILQVAVPTLRSIIKTYPDLPVLERGDKARQWQFDPHAVHAFLVERKKAEAAQRASRDDLLAQLTLPIGQVVGSVEHLPLSEQLAASKLRSLLRYEATECSFLVRVDEVASLAGMLEEGMRKSIEQTIVNVSADLRLPDAVATAMRTRFGHALDVFHRDLHQLLARGGASRTESLF